MHVLVSESRVMEKDHKKELAQRMREMQIQLIKEQHPVYGAFNFASYSDAKIAEMFSKLVKERTEGTPSIEDGKDSRMQ